MLKEISFNTKLKHTPEMINWLGGGHTYSTDPTNRGWRMWNLEGSTDRYEFVLVGVKGQEHCFLARSLDNGQIIVHYFYERPEDVRKVVLNDSILQGHSQIDNPLGIEYGSDETFDYYPGWGLRFINTCEERVAVDNAS